MREGTRPVGTEMTLAFVVGAAWFALSALVVATPLPRSAYVTVGVVLLDVVVVLAVAHYGDIPYAVTVGVASAVAIDWFHIPPTHPVALPDPQNASALVLYLLMAALLGELAVRARRRAVVAEGARSELAGEQAALRRVATLVAHQPAPAQVFAAVTHEVGRLLEVEIATMVRYEPDASATVVAAWSRSGRHIPVGTRLTLTGGNVAEHVRRTGRPARMTSFAQASGPLAATLRQMGVRSSAGSPIVVDGSVWGAMVAASTSAAPVPPGAEVRLGQFTELVATAVANAQARSELQASRQRLVSAANDARRRIERDLHDGVQQRLVSLALGLRLVSDRSGADRALSTQLADLEEGLVGTLADLRELSQGIHPAILTEGGLRPALATLARRSAVPVELDYRGPDRVAEPVEVAAYFVVSEALTNAAKHAGASLVRVDVDTEGPVATLSIRDDGVGGARQGDGTGLTGLTDRVDALGGRIDLSSPVGQGTAMTVTLPLHPPDDPVSLRKAVPAVSAAEQLTNRRA